MSNGVWRVRKIDKKSRAEQRRTRENTWVKQARAIDRKMREIKQELEADI